MKTINKYLLLLGSLAIVAGMTGCEDTRGEHLEDYASMIYFRNGGDQTISLYRVGENAPYQVPVCKSGSDLSYTAEATVMPVDQSQLDIYNMDKETNYVQIPGDGTGNGPDDCFRFTTETKLHFAPGETYKVVGVELFTDKISLLQEANPEKEYVLALQVYSDRQVSAKVNLLVLKPKITIPAVSFVEAGVHKLDFNSTSPTETTLTQEVGLGIENRWDFTCKLDVHDQAWLDNYNTVHKTEYEMMPAIYDLGDSTVVFTKGSNRGKFSVKIDRTNMDLFKDYVLPIYLKDCSQKYDDGTIMFKLNDAVFLVHAVYTTILDKITLTEEMLSSDYTSSDGQGIPALYDGKSDTYWHSLYSGTIPDGDPTYGVYIDIKLKEPLKIIQFKYQTRHNNNNAVPTLIRIGASTDGQNWTMIQEVKNDLPQATAAWGELPYVKVGEDYTYYRFGVATSALGDLCVNASKSTALGELEIYGSRDL